MKSSGRFLKKQVKVHDHDGVRWVEGTLSIPGMKMKSHFYIIDNLLLDTGPARLGSVSGEVFKEEKVARGAATHYHEDHTGMAPWLIREMKIPFFLHKEDVAIVKEATKLPNYRAFAWGNREGFIAAPLGEVLETDYHRFKIIDAPGHSPHHVVFHEAQKGWLFTGDLYVSSRQRVAFVDEHMGQTIGTLKKLLTLDFEHLFCGHAGLLPKGKDRFKEKLEVLQEIQGTVMDLYEKGLSIDEINRTLYPKKDLWFRFSRGEWSSRKIVSTLIEH